MAIIRSSNYNGSYDNSSSLWTNGTAGWVIGGDGHAEFASASIRGTVKAGSIFINANNRWKTDSSGNEIIAAEFRVGTNDSFLYWDGTNSLSVKGHITATSGQIGALIIVGDILSSGGNYSGYMRFGGGVGPLPPPSHGPGTATSALLIGSPVSPGVGSQCVYNGYGTRWSIGNEGESFSESYRMEADAAGIKYQYGDQKFEFRKIGDNLYIVVDGTQYQLTIGGGSGSGGGPGGGGTDGGGDSGGGDSGGSTPQCSCVNSSTFTATCADPILCNGPGCDPGCRYYTYDYYINSCVVDGNCTCAGVTCAGTVVTRSCSAPTVCV